MIRRRSYKAVRKGVIIEDIKDYKNTIELYHDYSEDFCFKITRIYNIEFTTADIAPVPPRRFSFKRLGRYAAIAVIAAVVAVNGMIPMMADAPKEPNLTFGMKTRPVANGMLEVKFLEGEIEGIQTLPVAFNYQSPTYIPEGYDLIEEIRDDTVNYMVYENDQDERLIYSQNNLWGLQNINRENAYVREVRIRGCEGIASSRLGSGSTIIVWSDGNYRYDVSCDSNKIDLFKVANSVRSDKNKNF
ncbi:DUF4367 domain-containing protein [Ruminococcus sp. Marseille-P6503]|uniref:DUF4367 domain-containing protein n=1 Tax=Ruminococcus sp. Marseille-P6503 TaxID=2364796 RepID=UPI000F52E363|nr:DUF4367 domain-containing protein [Ruminococcus sp. Marseille-P6503]